MSAEGANRSKEITEFQQKKQTARKRLETLQTVRKRQKNFSSRRLEKFAGAFDLGFCNASNASEYTKSVLSASDTLGFQGSACKNNNGFARHCNDGENLLIVLTFLTPSGSATMISSASVSHPSHNAVDHGVLLYEKT